MKPVLCLCLCCHLSFNPALFAADEPRPAEAPSDETSGVNPDPTKSGQNAPHDHGGVMTGYAGHYSCRVFSGLDRELCVALSDGEVREVRRLIDAGANIEARSAGRSTEGMTPLIVAVRYRWGPEAIRLLLDAGADVNAKDGQGSSALIRAIENRQTADHWLLQSLIDHGADVKARGAKEMTALMHAAMIDDPKSVARLIAAGSEVNARDAAGWTALMHANRRKSGFPEVVKLLIKHRADVNAAHKHGGTALMIAAYNCHPRAAKLLIDSGADVNAKDKSGWTPLICAAKGGSEPTVDLLIAAGADVDAKDRFGKTALTYASDNGQAETARSLMEAGAEP